MRWGIRLLVASATLFLAGCMQTAGGPAVSRGQVDAYLKAVSAARDRGVAMAYEGKADEAVREMAILVDEGRHTFGAGSSFVASAVLAKGVVLREARRYPEAETEFSQSLASFERLFGATSPIVGSNLAHLALTYQYMGRFPDAEPLRQRALEIAEKEKGAESDLAGIRWGEMAEMLIGLGRYVEAEEAQQKSLALLEKAGRTDWIPFILGLNRLAGIYDSLDRRDDMEAPLRRAVAITASSLSQASIFALRSRHALGVYLLKQDRVGEAETCLREGLDAVPSSPRPVPVSHVLLLTAMAEVKERQGAAAAAADLRKRAEEVAAQGKVS